MEDKIIVWCYKGGDRPKASLYTRADGGIAQYNLADLQFVTVDS